MAFRRLVREALAAPLGAPLATVFAAPCVTAIVAGAREDASEDVALAELLDALAAVGVPRGRAFVLLAPDGPPARDPAERARRQRHALGVPVLLHDPDRSAHYLAGRGGDGVALELDDELREAEAVVLVGERALGSGGRHLLVPGLASRATIDALRAAGGTDALDRAAAAASAAVGVDWALTWDTGDPPRVRAGTGRAVLPRPPGAAGGA